MWFFSPRCKSTVQYHICHTLPTSLQAFPNYPNHVLNNAVDKHAKATYKTEEKKKTFLRLYSIKKKKKEPEVTQLFKYSLCPPVKFGPRPAFMPVRWN